MLDAYQKHVTERAAQGLPPLPLTAAQTAELTTALSQKTAEQPQKLFSLLSERVPPGVDPAAAVKAEFLSAVALGLQDSPWIDRRQAVFLLGTMRGGYNIPPLIRLLDDPVLAVFAAEALSKTLLVFGAFAEIRSKAAANPFARTVMEAWAAAEWFTAKPEVPQQISLTVFKIDGEITTDDLSPAADAWSRPDIPLHAKAMLKARCSRPLETMAALQEKGLPLAFVGDVVGTGSSRKSATNSVLWHIGRDIDHVPNKRSGGVVIGGKIAPIFYNTLEDAGAFPIECDVSGLETGQHIILYPHEGKIVQADSGATVATFKLKTEVLLDSIRAGGRIPLIIGRNLCARARAALGLESGKIFRQAQVTARKVAGYTQAQKIVGRACSLPGIRPGVYCEPVVSSVGSQDTTGPMTRDELTELACLQFSADLVMQSFCHTAAYPKAVDKAMHATLPDFFIQRGGVALKPGDGVIHSWLNRMILPDTVGTGGDSHTRFPIGISFPAGSGLVAFGAAMGVMPLDMPESVLVRFSGQRQPGITIRDVVNAVPYVAVQQGLLTKAKSGKINVFSGRIMEMTGLTGLSVAEAFELTNASAERSAAAGVIQMDLDAVVSFLKSNLALLNDLIAQGYGARQTLKKRMAEMENWLKHPSLLTADADAEYAAIIEIDLDAIQEPIVACPNDPDDVRLLSEVAGNSIQEVFIGSCMTHLEHFRMAAKLLCGCRELPARLWITPPTRMDEQALEAYGCMDIFKQSGVRVEIPGCSLCMGNQARVADKAVVFSTSTRNFVNRMGDGADVYLGSAQLATICAFLGRIPTSDEYRRMMHSL